MPDDEDKYSGRPVPVLLLFALVFNLIPLVVCIIYALVYWTNDCTFKNYEIAGVEDQYENYIAFCVVHAVCFALNMLIGIYLHFRLRYRANTQVFKRAARLLTHDWIVAVYAVFFVFQLVWAPVTLVVTPGDEFCAEAETSLYQFMIVAPYLLIISLSAFLIGFFVNLLCECGRDAEEGDSFSEETNENENNDGDEDQEAPPVPKKKQSDETVDATPVNPFAEDDDKTSKKNKKKETPKKTNTADDEWMKEVAAARGES